MKQCDAGKHVDMEKSEKPENKFVIKTVILALKKVPRMLNEEKMVTSTNGAGKTRCSHEKSKTGPLSLTIQRINSEWTKESNIVPAIVELLKINMGHAINYTSLSNEIMDMTLKAWAASSRIDKWDYIKLKYSA